MVQINQSENRNSYSVRKLNNNYRLTHSASELWGFTCTKSNEDTTLLSYCLYEFTNNEREISIPHEAAECGIEKFRVHC